MTRLDLILWFIAGWFVASVIAAVIVCRCIPPSQDDEQVRGDTQSHNGSATRG
ncbi:hypothetical protein [Sphingomonas sp. MA1305]|uniref:hypothetical protein n=1 Tax=Sphingomonas sp. MA1305 TaxID=2479204 RepID=UPI0018DF7573|nr:hypothetical protein [Sphingomonas sp. MA1305]